MATRVITAHLDIKLARQLDTLAAELDRPRGWVVKEAVASYIATEEHRRQATLEALAELDAGEVVPHVEIEAWAASLSRRRPAKVAKSKR
ncbi:MAG: ribbon-helix-helix domain-containing protein [Steroidobacteraceae bacterium]